MKKPTHKMDQSHIQLAENEKKKKTEMQIISVDKPGMNQVIRYCYIVIIIYRSSEIHRAFVLTQAFILHFFFQFKFGFLL